MNNIQSILLCIVCLALGTFIGSLAKPKEVPLPLPKCPPQVTGHRYLQRCPGDGLTVEYRSTKKLPEGLVCGE